MMFSLRLLFLIIAIPILFLLGIRHLHLFTSPSIPASSSRPRTSIAQGTLLGATIADNLKTPVEAFRGIPYALPPVGERRFRRPEPVPAADEVIDAGRHGKRFSPPFRAID